MTDGNGVFQKEAWEPPVLPAFIPQGDMPGDKIHISEEHLQKARVLFPALMESLPELLAQNPWRRAVVAVCGGSGVGKSETASLLSFYLRDAGLGSYTLSGDNYPHRIPAQNDAERLRVFRAGALRGLVGSGRYTQECKQILHDLQTEDRDADPSQVASYPWMAVYQLEGRKALAGYLGTEQEINFEELTSIVGQFKNGSHSIYLKRMGRTPVELWYDEVDFSGVQVLVIEWTHGNSDRYQGVDFPILLNSTPQETLAYRKARHRDGGVDSPFTTLVLGLEQQQLESQAHRAKLILSKGGELLTYHQYRCLMAAE